MKAAIVLSVFIVAASNCFAAENLGPGVPAFSVRGGYRVTVAAENLGEVRFIEPGENGILYLSQPRAGNILALKDKGDGTYAVASKFVTGKPTVHGMCYKDGWLYFTQTGAIHKARATADGSAATEIVTIIPEGKLPKGGGHWWRSILVTDDYIYTSIGDAGNISDQTDTERQKIWRFDLDGENKRLFASGLRNTEKLRMRPGTSEVYGCDHGSDNYGGPLGEQAGKLQPLTDSMPPCEFNRYVDGGFYGHPFVVGTKAPRLEYQNRPDILQLVQKTIAPAWCFGAHWAPNGWTFLSKDTFPGHKGDAVVALHGSWNSVAKVGYRVERILFDKETGKPMGSYRIVSTLSKDGNEVLARPVDIAEAPDGSMLFSCDHTQRIYRIKWIGGAAKNAE